MINNFKAKVINIRESRVKVIREIQSMSQESGKNILSKDKNNTESNSNKLPCSVVYKVTREFRVCDNFALLHAVQKAEKINANILVVYTIQDVKWNCELRTIKFLLENIKKFEEKLRELNINFKIIFSKKSTKEFIDFCIEQNTILVVTDMSPMREHNKWQEGFVAATEGCGLHIVDAHNIIPVWELSDKEEFAARTIRTKIYKKIESYVETYTTQKELENIIKNNKNISKENFESLKENLSNLKDKYEYILENFKCEKNYVELDERFSGFGEDYAKEKLEEFLDIKIKSYGEGRNDPLAFAQSDLSPYINFGVINKLYILNMVLAKFDLKISDIMSADKNGSGELVKEGATEKINSLKAFVEELVVRGDLGENYCYNNPNYDNYEGVKDWAKKELGAHAGDKREYIYDVKELELASTHDELWNAAQNEMMLTGKMSGYMRMYWAKKILEWTPSASEAIKIAIHLNDKYNLDGWSPGGNIGVLWSVAGLHDRPWFKRPIYGMIRYMARSGCEKKFDVKEYVRKYNKDKNSKNENKNSDIVKIKANTLF